MYRPPREERWNTATHAVGLLLTCAVALWLTPKALAHPNFGLKVSIFLFLAAMFGVYFASTFSHYFTDQKRQSFFRRLDQAFIYLLIVATYSPISTAYLHGQYWDVILGLMWSLGSAGFVSKLFLGHRVQSVSIWIYLLLGWLPVFTGMPFHSEIGRLALFWFVTGGVVYSLGTLFLFNDKRVWYFHSVWHVMVMLGTACHLVMIECCLRS